MTSLAITGAAGRMGRSLIETIGQTEGVHLAGAIEVVGNSTIGLDAGVLAGGTPIGISIGNSLTEAMLQSEVLIDFSTPDATMENVRYCLAANKRMVIGTTGLNEQQRAEILAVSKKIAIMMAPNMSVGVNLCLHLLDHAARVLGDDFDVEIIEAHHRHKVDAPSGTALRMGEVVANALNRDLDACAVYGRQGLTGEREQKTIGFETIRAGDIVGEHTVMFAGQGERVEISHKASSRMTFSKGALRAAVWIMQHSSGLYDMQDVLGLR